MVVVYSSSDITMNMQQLQHVRCATRSIDLEVSTIFSLEDNLRSGDSMMHDLWTFYVGLIDFQIFSWRRKAINSHLMVVIIPLAGA